MARVTRPVLSRATPYRASLGLARPFRPLEARVHRFDRRRWSAATCGAEPSRPPTRLRARPESATPGHNRSVGIARRVVQLRRALRRIGLDRAQLVPQRHAHSDVQIRIPAMTARERLHRGRGEGASLDLRASPRHTHSGVQVRVQRLTPGRGIGSRRCRRRSDRRHRCDCRRDEKDETNSSWCRSEHVTLLSRAVEEHDRRTRTQRRRQGYP